MSLPRIAALQSCLTKKFMKVESNGEFNGCISFNGDSIYSPFAKIELVKANSEVGECYYVQSSYNNKYWIRKSDKANIVAAEGAEAEEESNKNDEGKNAVSNLFRVQFVDDNKTLVHFWDVNTGDVLHVNDGNHLTFGDSYLSDYLQSKFKIIDWDSFFILPKHVAFKGDNGKYLYAWYDNKEGKEFNQFWMDVSNHVGCHFEIFPNPDGTVRIKSKRYDKFWWRSEREWIWANSSESDTLDDRWKVDCSFWPVKVGPNKVALLCPGSNKYCGRWPKSGNFDDCLSGSETTLSKAAIMEVEELVVSREIYNVEFHVTDARIYGNEVLKKQTLSSENRGSKDVTTTLKFSHRKTTIRTWSATLSMKLGAEATFRAGIPIIAEGRVKVYAELTGSYTWGKTTEESKESAVDHQVTVPPKTKVIADLIAKEGCCDVPFSYTQRDTLYDGTVVVYTMDDGLFTGANTFDVQVVTREEPIY